MTTQKKTKKEFFLGHEKKTKKEVWHSHQEMQTHNLVLGACGSGKTEALIGLANNAIVQGSGLVFVDATGGVQLYGKILSMARASGREDDVLLINQMTGNRDLNNPQNIKLSHSFNPFERGSSSSLTLLLVSSLEQSGDDAKMWMGRAVSLISSLMMALVFMRDKKEICLDADMIREYLILGNIIKLYKSRLDLPKHAREALRAYLTSLPGFNEENVYEQSNTTLEQHGYLQMQFTRLLSSLSDKYGHILNTQLSEVNFTDVLLNRRIVVVLLAALEKSQDELASLGKFIVGSLKMSMTEQAPPGVLNKSAASSTFMTIFNEYGYYAIKGFAVMPVKARSLGISMTFAGQDLPAFEKTSKEEANSIIANCNTKIFMKMEDPRETYDLFKVAAGDELKKSQKRNTLLDLKDQNPGDAYVILKSTVTQIKMFYPKVEFLKNIRLNQFLQIETPTTENLSDEKIVTHLLAVKPNKEILNNDEFRMPNPFPQSRLKSVTNFFKPATMTLPFTAPTRGLNLAELSLTDGDYAMAKTPHEFCLEHNLLKNSDTEWLSSLYPEKAAAVFASQLGPIWDGYQNLSAINRCLFGLFAAQVAGDRTQVMDALEKISLSATPGEKPDFSAGLALAEKYHDHEKVVNVVSKHAYTYTILYQLLLTARENGILPSAWFIWLRPLNRTLYYALNSAGREVSWAESAGVFSHWKAETVKGESIKTPYVQSAVFALKKALT